MKNVYPVIFTETHDKKNTVLIEVPDFAIVTEGYGLADAIYMARDAIGQKGVYYEDNGRVIPTPSAIEKIDVSKGQFADCGTGYVSLVDIDFTEYRRKMDNRAVRKNVTIPCWMAREAEKAHINISRVLQEALQEKLQANKS